MTSTLATLAYAIAILGLFFLNREKNEQTSKALWIPVLWLCIAGSRMVGEWISGAAAAQAVSGNAYLDGSPFDRNLLTTFLLVGIVVLLFRRRRVTTILKANWPILLFFFYCLLSIAWSDFADVAFKRWVKALGDMVMVLVVLTDVNPFAAVKRLLARVGLLLIPISILFIKYYPDWGRSYDRWEGKPVYTGVTTNKNQLGMIALIAGLGAGWRFLHRPRTEAGRRKLGPFVAEGVMLAMVFWLLYVAHSATSLSCFVMAGILILLTSREWFRRLPILIHVSFFAMLAISVIALFTDSGGGLLGTLGRNSTLTGRTDIWNLVLTMTQSPLFGTGFESFWLGTRLQKIWDIWWWHPNEAHNGYIEVYINLGWVGITLLGILLITGYRNIIATFRTKPEMAEIKLAFFLVAVVYDFTESAIRTLNPIWILFLLSIMVVPETPAPEKDLPIITYHTDKLPEREPQFQTVARARLRQRQETP